MPQMVEHAHEQDNVEGAHGARAYVVDFELPVFHARAQQVADPVKARVVEAVNGNHLGAAALHFETEPAIPGAHVEHALAREILRNGKLCDSSLLRVQFRDPANLSAVRQFEGVPPSAREQAVAPFPYVGERMRFWGTHGCGDATAIIKDTASPQWNSVKRSRSFPFRRECIYIRMPAAALSTWAKPRSCAIACAATSPKTSWRTSRRAR